MKDIRIFVASSKELIAERNQLAFLVLSMEEEFAARGLRVRLAACICYFGCKVLFCRMETMGHTR